MGEREIYADTWTWTSRDETTTRVLAWLSRYGLLANAPESRATGDKQKRSHNAVQSNAMLV